MGNGIECRCSACGYTFLACYGIGYVFPSVYRETLEAAVNGEYGKEASEFFMNHPDGAINAASSVYVCLECDNLQWERNLALYTRMDKNDPEVGKDYVMPYDLKRYYKLYKSHTHRCERCGGKMKTLREKTIINLIGEHELHCPVCGGELDGDDVEWD